jgi:hypothetical protein
MLYVKTDEVARNGTLLRLTRPEDLLSVSLLLGNFFLLGALAVLTRVVPSPEDPCQRGAGWRQ